MATAFLVVLLCGLFVPLCNAEAQWCNRVTKVSGDPLFYPPIARAARVSGVATIRLTLDAEGKVADVAKISGPPMLLTFYAKQLQHWQFRADAAGHPCQFLAIASFQIGPNSITEAWKSQLPIGNILRFSVEAEPLILDVISDPMPTTWRSHHFPWFRKRRRFAE
ncbi:energy transducer TonB [Silvibacterium dinghuense]|nr:energy transducer TonB [Silvibacterium dinghuense]GGH00416.1 hypothetical protein GCM10011586_15020 [Silvibacterium dinghuense]